MTLSYNHISNLSELDDVLSLAELTVDCMIESPKFSVCKTNAVIEKYTDDIIVALTDHEHLIIEQDKSPIGYMSCEHQGDEALWLFDTYLKPEYRKQGHFLASLQYLSNRAKEKGFSKVYFDIRDDEYEDTEGNINTEKKARWESNISKAGFTVSYLFRKYNPFNRASTENFRKSE